MVSGQSVEDGDGDGLPDWWEQQYFGGVSQLTSDDEDGDGSNNLTEYVAGTDPLNAQSMFTIQEFVPNEGGYVISWNSVEGRSYQVLKSSNLVFDEFSPISSIFLSSKSIYGFGGAHGSTVVLSNRGELALREVDEFGGAIFDRFKEETSIGLGGNSTI